MNLIDFNSRFPDEESCREYLKQKREAEGIICTCGSTSNYWIRTRELWKCKTCGTCQNLRAGTIMEKSHIPVRFWFMALHLMTSTKKSFSALEMQRQLGFWCNAWFHGFSLITLYIPTYNCKCLVSWTTYSQSNVFFWTDCLFKCTTISGSIEF